MNNENQKTIKANHDILSHFSLWHKVGDMEYVPVRGENLSGRWDWK